MDPDPESQLETGFELQEPSSTINMLWDDCDLEAAFAETFDEVETETTYRLAA
jgi:hypothetical protein